MSKNVLVQMNHDLLLRNTIADGACGRTRTLGQSICKKSGIFAKTWHCDLLTVINIFFILIKRKRFRVSFLHVFTLFYSRYFKNVTLKSWMSISSSSSCSNTFSRIVSAISLQSQHT